MDIPAVVSLITAFNTPTDIHTNFEHRTTDLKNTRIILSLARNSTNDRFVSTDSGKRLTICGWLSLFRVLQVDSIKTVF